MRIVDVDMPNLPDFGLRDIRMERLGSLVVLAGKNGSGKSRFLERLSAWTSGNDGWPFGTLETLKREARKNGVVENGASGWWDPGLAHWMWRTAAKNEPQRLETVLRNFFNLAFDSGDSPQIVHFVPKYLHLDDPAAVTPDSLLQRSSRVESVGMDQLNSNALSRIQHLQNRWWSAKHPSSTLPREDREAAIERYEKLNALVLRFLGVVLERNLDDRATLFGLPIGKPHLSDGQKVLLQFCVAVHAQADKLSELIVLMDEPENHLHPGALLEVIESIRAALPKGQLWIATHSVPLLAQVDPESIWWMENGTIRRAGSTPETVLQGLIGNDDRICKLNEFLGLPAALAANRFAHQCLLPPAVVTTGSDDPQTTQIAKILDGCRPGNALKMVDFGAGRGRLAAALLESGASTDELRRRIDYRAYDFLDTFKTDCEAAVERLCGSADRKCFYSEQDLRSCIDPGSVDVVVMCNVLHEIDPQEWLDLFSEHGLIRYLLRTDGFLLLVEDTEMRIGEKAHQSGFLVLNTAELRTFFAIKEADVGFKAEDERKDGRLKAHLVPTQCLGRANQDTFVAALKQVKHLACEEIKKLRSREPNYKLGRKHAFHVQQLANATLALKTFGEDK
jgi:energy-coupling factor transporter ATP-binding protein EcfA2